ncbi:diacylglycerol kinase, partial [Proteus mirabilis]
RHELSGRATDMGSAAVLVAIIWGLFTWGTILGHHFFA